MYMPPHIREELARQRERELRRSAGRYTPPRHLHRRHGSARYRAGWSNSTIIRGDVVAQVTKIKEQHGRDLALFGHGRLAQTLLENGLIDELRLAILPVLAGAGLPQFSNGHKTPLRLVSAKTFTTGVVVLSYQTAGA